MPSYTFRDNETGEEYTKIMNMGERETYLNENPNVIQILTPTPLCDPTRVGVRTKPDSGFRDVLQKVKGAHYKSTVNTW